MSVVDLVKFPFFQNYRTYPLEKDCAYLADLFGLALVEELVNLAQITQLASATLAFDGTGRSEALWSDSTVLRSNV